MNSTSMSDFKIEKVLGKGSFGSVYLVTRKADNKIYAIKTVVLDKLKKKEQENSVNEVRILASINHPNVIGYKEAFWNDKESSLNIVMEYADDGDLQSKIHKMRQEGGMFNENLIWSYSIQMIEGLKALHDKKIMHRDLKSANIFLVKDKHQCKLGDMNVSKVIKDKVLLTQTGTPYYASPEVWNDKPYSYKSDLWSIGCVIYELCSLYPPFGGRDLDELYANVCKGKIKRINKIYSDDLWKMINMLLQVDVNKRVDCDQFLKSKLILRKKKELKEKSNDFNYLENKLGENINNSILLSTIKFTNINEIKSQLPKNKNYNDENFNSSNFNKNINNDFEILTNRNDKIKSFNNINQININNDYNINYNDFIKNKKIIISNEENKNNNPPSNNRNKRLDRSAKSIQNITNYLINKTNSIEKNDYNHNYKDYKLKREYNLSNIYNKENSKDRSQQQSSTKLSNINDNIKLYSQIQSTNDLRTSNGIDNNTQNNNKREFTLNEYTNSEYLKKLIINNKERFKTEQQKENFKKIKQYNKVNPKSSIPTSIKRNSTCRQNVPKLKNDRNYNFKFKRENNHSYLKIDESKLTNKYKNKYNLPLKINSITEARSKTPNIFNKINNKINNNIFCNYNNYGNNFNKIKKKEISEHQKSVGYLRHNLKTSISEKEINDKYNFFYNSKAHKCSKSITNINSNININNNIKNEIIKKKVVSSSKENINKKRPISAMLSKRIVDINNLNINNNKSIILGPGFIHKDNHTAQYNSNKKQKCIRSSNSYFNLNSNNNNLKLNKAINNQSTVNINYDKIISKIHYRPINERYNFVNQKNENNYFYDKNPTSIELNNNDYNYYLKKVSVNNEPNFRNKIETNYNKKNIKKIKIIPNITNKRTFDDKYIRERKKKEIGTNIDLTEPELRMFFDQIKCKEIAGNNNRKKSLNISLNENINQNNFLKHIKQVKPININNVRLNQYYSNNNNKNSINNIKNIERERGTKIYNNYYSINNIGNYKIPVKVINVFN